MRTGTPRPIRVLVAESFAMTSDSICRALQVPGVSVVGQAADAIGALAGTRRLRPDLVVLDGLMAYRKGLISRLKRLRRPPKVILLGDHAEEVYQEAATASGADGFVLKVRLLQDLPAAIHAAFAFSDEGE